jgi:superfamily I DNA/RNA helicase
MWSDEQQAILNGVANTEDNLIIESVAGSGKTSVIVEAAQSVPSNSIFLAFNKKIVQELSNKLPEHCQASTFHSVCWQFLKERLPRGAKVNQYKSYDLLDKITVGVGSAKPEVARLVSVAKNAGVGIFEPAKPEIFEELRENYDIVSEEVENEAICIAARQILRANERNLQDVDFDDMLYMTLKFIKERGWSMHRYHTVFVDEAQDTNGVQLALLNEMANRVIAVGDSYQAIYGFRGAGSNSMPDIKTMFGCHQYTMSISWRCPENVAKLAREIVPHFKARPGAPDGYVEHHTPDKLMDFTSENDMIICRQNAPLFGVALKLLKQRTPFKMTGKFPAMMQRFVKAFKTDDIPEFRERLTEWWKKQEAELTKKCKWGVLEREEDKFNCLWMLQKECTSVGEIISKLELMMNSRYGVTLSTVHGAKGLEASVVVILMPELMPSKYAKTEAQMQQEMNLKYVVQTRAMFKLVHISGEG